MHDSKGRASISSCFYGEISLHWAHHRSGKERMKREKMKKRKKGWLFLLLASGALFLGSCSGTAEGGAAGGGTEQLDSFLFTRELELICPWAEGGSADANARVLAQLVGEQLGQVVMVTNRTGQGGAVGFSAQAEAEPDGYTLGIVTADLNTLLAQGDTGYTLEDFYPVIRMNTVPACVAVPADSPFETLEELLAYAREHPGGLKTGDVGDGSIWYLCAARLEQEADVTFDHDSYEGAAPAAADLVAGNLDLVTLEPAVLQPYVESGKARILAVMSEERLEAFAQYPTCRELGYSLVAGSFQGIVCPADVPQEQKEQLERLFTEAYESETYQEFCREYGLERSYLSAVDFQTFLEEDLERIGEELQKLEEKAM